jgi:2-polyprenyl-6-methoxyphenol hydroxylase-like FAD-dependent oxidoreductase
MPTHRVVIIGASTTGLFAAAAAAGSGRAVTVLERDDLPPDPVARPGVPQGRQPHVFLHRGLLAAEQLLPGFRDDLLAVGAVPFNTAELAWLGEQGWANRTSRSFEVLSTSRPLLETTLRRRVVELTGVQVVGGRQVVGLEATGTRWTVSTADGGEFDADLVIDASGRNSRVAAWLGNPLAGAVRTTQIDARVGYATRRYRGDPRIGDIPGVLIASTPTTSTGGLAISVEGGHWLIGALGVGDDRPPRDVAGFEAFLDGLRDPALARLAQRLEPVSDVNVHRQTANRRRHYDERDDWPDGVVVMGDAFCAFNPVYGQGIAVGACEAVLVRDVINAGMTPGAARRLLRQFGKMVALPWSVATATDLQFPTCQQDPTRLGALQDNWAKQLEKLSVHGNARAAFALSSVYHLMAPPRRLLQPALIWASVIGGLRGYGPANPRPADLPE